MWSIKNGCYLEQIDDTLETAVNLLSSINVFCVIGYASSLSSLVQLLHGRVACFKLIRVRHGIRSQISLQRGRRCCHLLK